MPALLASLLAALNPMCEVKSDPIACVAPAPMRSSVGSTSVADPFNRGLWLIDAEHDEVALMLETGTSRRYKVGRWPQSLVVAETGRVFVSSRESGRIDIIEPDHRQQHVDVGDEPGPLALDEDRSRLYVGLVTGKAIVALDTTSLQPVARIDLANEPTAIAMTRAGLAVASSRDRAVRFFDAALKEETRQVDLPQQRATILSPRLLVPIGDGIVVVAERARTGLDQPVNSGGYGGAQADPIETQLFTIDWLDRGYRPARFLTSIKADGPIAAFHLNAVIHLVSRGRGALVSMGYAWETGGLSIPDETHPSLWKQLAPELRGYLDMNGEPLSLQVDVVGAAAMNDGTVALTDALSRRVFQLKLPEPGPVPTPRVTQIARRDDFGTTSLSSREGLFDRGSFMRPLRLKQVVPSKVSALAPGNDVQLRVGEALFHASTDQRVSSHSVACASCHPDGREDGRVWSLQGTRRQTPMLAHRLEGTGPFNWLGTAKTLESNLMQTMVDRLEGDGLQDRELKALTRYVREGLRPVGAPAPKAPELVAMGREIFNDATVGCAACHPSDFETTDGERHDVGSLSAAERQEFRGAQLAWRMLDMRVMPPPIKETMRMPPPPAFRPPPMVRRAPRSFDTPSLKAIARTAPYFHDGSAASLASLIDNNADRMGTTSHLDATQRRALVAYLETL